MKVIFNKGRYRAARAAKKPIKLQVMEIAGNCAVAWKTKTIKPRHMRVSGAYYSR